MIKLQVLVFESFQENLYFSTSSSSPSSLPPAVPLLRRQRRNSNYYSCFHKFQEKQSSPPQVKQHLVFILSSSQASLKSPHQSSSPYLQSINVVSKINVRNSLMNGIERMFPIYFRDSLPLGLYIFHSILFECGLRSSRCPNIRSNNPHPCILLIVKMV